MPKTYTKKLQAIRHHCTTSDIFFHPGTAFPYTDAHSIQDIADVYLANWTERSPKIKSGMVGRTNPLDILSFFGHGY